MLMTPGVHGTDSHYTDNYHHHNTRPTFFYLDPPTTGTTNPTHQPTLQHHSALCFSDFLTGDSENSEVAETISITKFDTNDIDLSEMVEAANDPLRVRCLTELGPDHVVFSTPIIDFRLSRSSSTKFVDAMFEQLAQPYRTVNNHRIYIKASQATVRNIARAFAQFNLLDIDLARQPTGLLHRAREPADHHGTHRIAKETNLPWRTHGHLPDLPQNELGNSCQNSGGRLHSLGNFGQKTKLAYQLNTHVTGSSECSLRSQTSTPFPAMLSRSVPLSSTKLARNKTHHACWPFAAHQNAFVPLLEEMTKFNACATLRA